MTPPGYGGPPPTELVEYGQGIGLATFAQAAPPVALSPRWNTGRSVQVRRGQTLAVIDTTLPETNHTYTLALVRRDVAEDGVNPNALVDAGLVAQLQFGSAGCVEICSVDWVNGLLITIPAGSLLVRCEYPAVTGFAVDLQQFVGVIVTPGTRPPAAGVVSQPRLTTRIGVVNPGVTAVVPAPPRSHAVRLLTTFPNLYGSFRLGFNPTIKLADEYYFVDPTDALDEFPLGAAVRSVTVQNNAAVPVALSLLWSIAL